MENFELFGKTHYYFGEGAEHEVGKYIKELKHSKIALVYRQHDPNHDLINKVYSSLEQNDLEVFKISFSSFSDELNFVNALISLCKDKNIDFLLCVGNHNLLNLVKNIALGAVFDGDFFVSFYEQMHPIEKTLDFACVLTDFASKLEDLEGASFKKELNGAIVKKNISSKYLIPKFILLNPENVSYLSSEERLCSIVNLFSLIVSCYFTNTQDLSVSDRLCESLINSIIETAPLVLSDPDDYDAWTNILLVDVLFSNDLCKIGRKLDNAPQLLQAQISSFYNLKEGMTYSLILPAWIEHVLAHDMMRFVKFANHIFNVEINLEDPVRTAKLGVKALRGFYKHLGMPLTFKELKANKNDIPKFLRNLGFEDELNILGKFLVLNREDCEHIYNIAADYKE